MAPRGRKRARRSSSTQQALKLSPKEQVLQRAGLLPRGLTPAQRRRVAKLSLAEAKALASAKRKTGYPGTLLIKGFFF